MIYVHEVQVQHKIIQFLADPLLLNLQCLPSFWVMTWNSVTILNRILHEGFSQILIFKVASLILWT